MRASQVLKFSALTIVTALTVGAVLHGLRAATVDTDDDEEEISSTTEIRLVEGKPRLFLTDAYLKASGIRIADAMPVTYDPSVSVVASIVLPQLLADRRKDYETARAAMLHTRVAVKASRLEVERLKPLQRDGRIVSDRTLEAAENALATEEANANASAAEINALETALRQQWGAPLADWIIKGNRHFDNIVAGRKRLVQLPLQAGLHPASLKTAILEDVDGSRRTIPVISRVEQANSLFQGEVYLGIADTAPALLPGATLRASVRVVGALHGINVSEHAVVFWNGNPWVFVRNNDGGFSRELISTDAPTPDGYLCTSLPAGTTIVEEGAALLLSEELKASPVRQGG